MLGGDLPPGGVRRRQRGGVGERRGERVGVVGVDQHPGLAGDELRRAADGGGEDRPLHRHRLERGLAEGLDQRRLAEHVAGGDPGRNVLLRHAADEPHAVAALELRPQGAVADEREPAGAVTLERIGEPEHVLALDQRADAQERGAVAVPAELGAGDGRVGGRERVEVHPAVDHAELRLRRGNPVDEPLGEPARVRDQGGRASDDPAARRSDAVDLAEVRDVLAVRHHDQRRAGGERRERPGGAGREQEVGEDDVGRMAARGGHRLGDEAGVLRARAAPVADRHHVDLVPEGLELAADRDEKAPEIGIRGARPHLGHQQDAHAG